LSGKLVLGFCSQEVTGLQVSRHVCSLSGRSGGYGPSDEIGEDCGVSVVSLAFGHTSKDNLGCLGTYGNGIYVRVARRLNTNEGEDESEQQGQNTLANTLDRK
jgi:hypothetical protein